MPKEVAGLWLQVSVAFTMLFSLPEVSFFLLATFRGSKPHWKVVCSLRLSLHIREKSMPSPDHVQTIETVNALQSHVLFS